MFRLRKGEQPLHKKVRLIHVLDWICSETGCLLMWDKAGDIVWDAWTIIYPGANGDPWWDIFQLIAQVKSAIEIFDPAHPGCQALFIFDQSSAHTSLPPDALQAFDMNKSDGGEQQIQCDTTILESNPDPHYHGQAWPMTTPDRKAKGLKTVLTECGFNLKGLKAKCSQVCPFKSQKCCMAHLMSQKDDFVNQTSQLEILIKASGHNAYSYPNFTVSSILLKW